MRLASLALVFVAIVAATTSRPAAGPLVVRDIDGRESTPLAPRAGETNLLFFISTDCPISRRYAPEIDRIIAGYAPRGVHAWLVYPDVSIEANAIRENVQAFHAGTPAAVVIDRTLALTTAVDATITPEAAVYSASGRRYLGRIDDLYPTLGQARPAATRHDLRDALDAVIAGRPVAAPVTTAVGCYIERTPR